MKHLSSKGGADLDRLITETSQAGNSSNKDLSAESPHAYQML